MRRWPSSWDVALTKLGLKRRKTRRKSDQQHRRSRFESLEVRALLSGDPLTDPFGPDTAQYASGTADEPVTVVVRPAFVLVQGEPTAGLRASEGALIEPLYLMETVYTEQGPFGTLRLNPNSSVGPPEGLHELKIELRLGGMVLETYDIAIDIAESGFRDRFLADRVKLATNEGGPGEDDTLGVLGLQEASATAQTLAESIKDAQTSAVLEALSQAINVLGNVARRQHTESNVFVGPADRLAFYESLTSVTSSLKQSRDLNSAPEHEMAEDVAKDLGTVALLIADDLSQDLKSLDVAVRTAAEALRNELAATVDPYYTLFTGLEIDREVKRAVNLKGTTTIVGFTESGTFRPGDQLRIVLGSHQAMVQVRRSTEGSETAALESQYPGGVYIRDTYINKTNEDTYFGSANPLHLEYDESEVVIATSMPTEMLGRYINESRLDLTVDVDMTGYIQVKSGHDRYGYFAESVEVIDWVNFHSLGESWNDYFPDYLDFLEVTQTGIQTLSLDLTDEVQRALLFGDANFDVHIDVTGSSDVEAFHLAVTNWDAYVAEYGDRQILEDDFLYRNDANLNGSISSGDAGAFFRRLGFSLGDYNLNGTVDNNQGGVNGYDWAIYQSNYGLANARFTQGDGNFNGVVDAGDFHVWVASTYQDNLEPEVPELGLHLFGVDSSIALTIVSEEASTNKPTLVIDAMHDLAVNEFTVSDDAIAIDYSVVGSSVTNVKLEVFYLHDPETAIAAFDGTDGVSSTAGRHTFLFDAAELGTIQTDERLGTRITGSLPMGATNASTENDSREFEFSGATAITVNSLDDGGIDVLRRGYITLREALEATTALPWIDTITFNTALFVDGAGTIPLSFDAQGTGTPDQLEVDSDISILGPGANLLTIDARGATRVFNVYSAATDAVIADVTITGGGGTSDGGGVYLGYGTLMLDGVRIVNNESYSGGGIVNMSGDLTIKNSEISGNQAVWGGGIAHSGGSLTVLNTTISGNTIEELAPSFGGEGGGIYGLKNATIINSTIVDNIGVYGAGLFDSGYGNPTPEIHNSIIAGNWDVWQYPSNLGGSWTAATGSSHNIIGGASTAGGFVDNRPGSSGYDPQVPTNYVGLTSAQLHLAPLDFYGGTTKTHIPLPTSPAIDKGNDDVAATFALLGDARGADYPRDLAGAVDIGAVEANVIFNGYEILYIWGTNADDLIWIDSDKVVLDTVGGYAFDVPSATLLVEARALDGNDYIALDEAFAQNAMLYGGDGDDILEGGRGEFNVLSGGAGNDTYFNNPQAYNTTFHEGAGDDTYYVRDTEYQVGSRVTISPDPYSAPGGVDLLSFAWMLYGGVTVSLASDQWQQLQGSPCGLELRISQSTDFGGGVDIENLMGSTFDDSLTGNELHNSIWGEAGNDHIKGGEGNDMLVGGSGDDQLDGQHGNDFLYGQDGSDELTGGSGNDYLNGGLGEDFLDGQGGFDHIAGDGQDLPRAPQFLSIENQEIRVDLRFATRLLADDDDPYEELFFEAWISGGTLSQPEYLPVVNGVLSWEPLPGGVGLYTVEVKVTDSDALIDTTEFDILVQDYNFLPPYGAEYWPDTATDDPLTFITSTLYHPDQHQFDTFDSQTPPHLLTYNLISGAPSASLTLSGIFVWSPPGVAPAHGLNDNGTGLPIDLEWVTPYRFIFEVTDQAVGNAGARTRKTALVGYNSDYLDFDRIESTIGSLDMGYAIDDHFDTAMNTPLIGNVAFGNPSSIRADQATGTFELVGSGPSHSSSFQLLPGGGFSYTPAPGFRGIDTFQYRIRNDEGWWEYDGTFSYQDTLSNVATVVIEVGSAVYADINIGLPEEEEDVSPGRTVQLNSDDDNGNLRDDRKDVLGPVSEEDDLVPASLSYWLRDDAYIDDFVATLIVNADNAIRIWTSPNKEGELFPQTPNSIGQEWKLADLPSEIWIEGLAEGAVSLMLSIYGPSTSLFTGLVTPYDGGRASTNVSDLVQLTVSSVDIDISHGQGGSQVPDELEGPKQVGSVTVANLNDTDGDGRIDATDDIVRVTLHQVTLSSPLQNTTVIPLDAALPSDHTFLPGDKVLVMSPGGDQYESVTIAEVNPNDSIVLTEPLVGLFTGSVIVRHSGRNEVDLVKLQLSSNAGLGGTYQLKVPPGVRIWTKSTKEVLFAEENSTMTVVLYDPLELWAEVIQVSKGARDKTISLEHTSPDGMKTTDEVAVTGIWSTVVEVRHDASDKKWPWKASHPIHPGEAMETQSFGLAETIVNGIGDRDITRNGIGFKFQVSPKSVLPDHDPRYENIVHVDITRAVESQDFKKLPDGDWTFDLDWEPGVLSSLPPFEEMPNDDEEDWDESKRPDSLGYMYSLDAPAIHMLGNLPDGSKNVYRLGAREWLRITIEGETEGEVVGGSRASEYFEWHSVITTEKHTEGGFVVWRRSPGVLFNEQPAWNSIGPGIPWDNINDLPNDD